MAQWAASGPQTTGCSRTGEGENWPRNGTITIKFRLSNQPASGGLCTPLGASGRSVASWVFGSKSNILQGGQRYPRSQVFCSPALCPGSPSDSSSPFHPAAASLNPTWPGQPLPREQMTHAAPLGISTGAMVVTTVRPHRPHLCLPRPPANPRSPASVLCCEPRPGHFWGSQGLPHWRPLGRACGAGWL